MWQFVARREKRQAPAPPVAIAAVKDHGSGSTNHSPAPAKPPRTYESDAEQTENVEPVEPVMNAGQSAAKRRAPHPPTSHSAWELSPLHTSTPVSTIPSPVKMMKVDEEADSPVKATASKNDVVDTPAAQEDKQTVDVPSIQTGAGNKMVNNTTEKKDVGNKVADSATEIKGTTPTGHVSSATLVFGGSASAASRTGVAKSTPAKVAVSQRTGPSVVQSAAPAKSSSSSSTDDSMMEEPTTQPVAARLAAWQTKQSSLTTQEPLVSSRVKNYERKITASDNAKSPLKRPQLELASGKSTAVASAKMSPVRAAAAVANSPVKSALSSPQKLSPATRAIQERLTQISEAGTRNAAVDRERQERAAELADVENRWQRSPATAASNVSFSVCFIISIKEVVFYPTFCLFVFLFIYFSVYLLATSHKNY